MTKCNRCPKEGAKIFLVNQFLCIGIGWPDTSLESDRIFHLALLGNIRPAGAVLRVQATRRLAQDCLFRKQRLLRQFPLYLWGRCNRNEINLATFEEFVRVTIEFRHARVFCNYLCAFGVAVAHRDKVQILDSLQGVDIRHAPTPSQLLRPARHSFLVLIFILATRRIILDILGLMPYPQVE